MDAPTLALKLSALGAVDAAAGTVTKSDGAVINYVQDNSDPDNPTLTVILHLQFVPQQDNPTNLPENIERAVRSAVYQ